jgi:hypothetical protein
LLDLRLAEALYLYLINSRDNSILLLSNTKLTGAVVEVG